MSAIKNRIATLLAQDIKPAQVSRALNISEGYISNLVEHDESFQAILHEEQGKIVVQEIEINEKYDTLEHSVLGAMNELIPTADMRELTMALKSVGERHQRVGNGKGVGTNNGVGITVAVTLPMHISQPILTKVNERNEIVEVQGKSMVSLTAQQLGDKLSSMGRSSLDTVIDKAIIEVNELREADSAIVGDISHETLTEQQNSVIQPAESSSTSTNANLGAIAALMQGNTLVQT